MILRVVLIKTALIIRRITIFKNSSLHKSKLTKYFYGTQMKVEHEHVFLLAGFDCFTQCNVTSEQAERQQAQAIKYAL